MMFRRLFGLALPVAISCALLAGTSPAQPRSVPEWARGIVWYQIMPDRFWNADSTNDAVATEVFPKNKHAWEPSRWTSNWYELTPKELSNSNSFYENAFLRQYGGDLKGIERRLDYLAAVGVNGLVLSPVFEARSAHKYDIASFHHIDEHLGAKVLADTALIQRENPVDPKSWYLTSADRTFVDFLHEVHRRGMRVVVDMQFAHVSVDFWAFRDVLRNQEKSPYGNWFVIDDWDRPETPYQSEFSYRSMWNVASFPVLRQDTLGLVAGPKEYVFACTRKWMDPDGNGDPSDGVDGWRLDLTRELPLAFWREWVAFVKSINPSAVVISLQEYSAWEKAPFDIISSDRFARQSTRFFLNRSSTPTQLDRELTAVSPGLGDAGIDAQINRIGDLETDRIASMCANPSIPYERGNSPASNPKYNFRKPNRMERATQKKLLLFQCTVPGSPQILYGDETGMWGSDDPDCRKPMVWPELHFDPETTFPLDGDTTRYSVEYDSTIAAYYASLIELRKNHVCLRQGTFRTILIDDTRMLYGYVRESGADRVYLVFNQSADVQACTLYFPELAAGSRIDAPLQRLVFFTEKDGLTIHIPPGDGILLIPYR